MASLGRRRGRRHFVPVDVSGLKREEALPVEQFVKHLAPSVSILGKSD
jgi:hypothetical protein